MYGKDIPLFCLAYILGILITSAIDQYALTILIFGLITGGLAWKFASYHQWLGLRSRSLLVIILIILTSFFYFYLRFPTAKSNDVSQIIPSDTNGISTTVMGKVINSPTLNRSGKLRFWLETETVNNDQKNMAVEGKLYATIPLNLEDKISSGSKIEITGYLYQPSTPKNPGQFDFKEYLKRNGAFAGISGRELTVIQKNNWGFWRLRDRIIKVHQKALDSPKGMLVSSMVLGRRAVSLPYELQEEFLRAGLAHFLAASGFHVSLLLGFILVITKRFRASISLIIGLGILLLYVGLTGLQPSILRASLMGIAGLIGLVTDRKVGAVKSLLMIATILLLINPLWIIDLGFQFSFLATLGLIVTIPNFLDKLEFLPPTLAKLIAVPIVAFVWIFPLQLFYFGTVAPYSIILNILATPLAILIILGGMLSGFIGLLVSDLGSLIALLLSYPTQGLISLVSVFNRLPASYLLFGKIALWQLLTVYSLILFVWRVPQGKKYWKLVSLSAIALLIFPVIYKQFTLQQITVFATEKPAVILIQNRGHTTLINCGDENTIQYTILPFLQQEGVQTIDSAIALSSQNQWQYLLENVSIKSLFNSQITAREVETLFNVQAVVKKPFDLLKNRRLTLERINSIFTINLNKKSWGFLENPTRSISSFPEDLKAIDVLLWEGKRLDRSWLAILKPKTVILVSNEILEEFKQDLQQKRINVHVTGEEGAIQWTSYVLF